MSNIIFVFFDFFTGQQGKGAPGHAQQVAQGVDGGNLAQERPLKLSELTPWKRQQHAGDLTFDLGNDGFAIAEAVVGIGK